MKFRLVTPLMAGLLTAGAFTFAQPAHATIEGVECYNEPHYRAECFLDDPYSSGEAWKVNGSAYTAGAGRYLITFGCLPNALYRVDVSYYDSSGTYHADDSATGYCTSVNQ